MEVQLQVANPNFSCQLMLRSHARAPQQGFDARTQLTRAKRFVEVVIRADLQTANSIFLGSPAADHDDGRITAMSDLTTQLEPVDFGKDSVEQHHAWLVGLPYGESLLT